MFPLSHRYQHLDLIENPFFVLSLKWLNAVHILKASGHIRSSKRAVQVNVYITKIATGRYKQSKKTVKTQTFPVSFCMWESNKGNMPSLPSNIKMQTAAGSMLSLLRNVFQLSLNMQLWICMCTKGCVCMCVCLACSPCQNNRSFQLIFKTLKFRR